MEDLGKIIESCTLFLRTKAKTEHESMRNTIASINTLQFHIRADSRKVAQMTGELALPKNNENVVYLRDTLKMHREYYDILAERMRYEYSEHVPQATPAQPDVAALLKKLELYEQKFGPQSTW